MKMRFALAAALLAQPAFAAEGGYGFTSLFNTDYVVLIGFTLFLAILFWFDVPGLLMRLLDGRAETIRAELAEARALRDEAQGILASYERKSREVTEQSERIIAQARDEARLAAEQAKADLQASIARRLAAAEDQIASAEAKALRAVRDRAVDVAIATAAELIASATSAADAGKRIDSAIAEVDKRLH